MLHCLLPRNRQELHGAVGSKTGTGNPNAVPCFDGICSGKGSACFWQKSLIVFSALRTSGQNSTRWWTRHKEIFKLLSFYIQTEQSQEALFVQGQKIFVPWKGRQYSKLKCENTVGFLSGLWRMFSYLQLCKTRRNTGGGLSSLVISSAFGHSPVSALGLPLIYLFIFKFWLMPLSPEGELWHCAICKVIAVWCRKPRGETQAGFTRLAVQKRD